MRISPLSAMLVMAAALVAQPAGAFQISLAPPLSPIAVGDNFKVLVSAEDLFAGRAGDSLLAYAFDVETAGAASFDAATVATAQGFADDSGLTGLDVSASTFPSFADPGGTTGLLLSELTLTALTVGPFDLTVSADATDPVQGLFFFADGQAGFSETVTIPVQAAPIPGTVLLLGMGLAALVRRRTG